MMTKNFYDTCSLLLKAGNLFEQEENIVLSSITLEELENIKTATNRDPDVKYAARKLLHDLDEHPDAYEIVIYKDEYFHTYIAPTGISMTNDAKIIACGLEYARLNPQSEIVFMTNDLSCKHIAKLFFDDVQSIKEENEDIYEGFKIVTLSDDEMTDLYCTPEKNHFGLMINEYLVVKNKEGEIVDRLCWTGEDYRRLNFNSFKSVWFGDVKPMKGDVYQMLAADSLTNNRITMVKGPAGSGKTYLSLGFLMSKLERHQIDKIIVFCNTVATKNSAKLGYYPGTRDEKLLDSQIGNLLISKFGGRLAVEQMIHEERLVLLPLSDIRGYDTTGMRAGIYISEAQNLDISLMKLALQRIGEDSICIIDGDEKAQVDDISFAGANNGMRRASKVFRGNDIYGEVTLHQIHRSRIAQLAENM